MRKKILEKRMQRLEAKRTTLVERAKASQDVNEVRSINEQLEDINAEIENMVKRMVDLLDSAGMLRDGWRERDYMFQGEGNDMDMTCNAQAFINISRKRLCIGCASTETREAWELVIEYLKEVDPILASKCVPECIYRGFCPETDRCCGYCGTKKYRDRLMEYRTV